MPPAMTMRTVRCGPMTLGPRGSERSDTLESLSSLDSPLAERHGSAGAWPHGGEGAGPRPARRAPLALTAGPIDESPDPALLTGSMRPRLPFDRVTWTRWRNAIRSFARSAAGRRAKALFAALLALLIVINGLNVVNSYVGRDFMTAIEERDMPGFVAQARALHRCLRPLDRRRRRLSLHRGASRAALARVAHPAPPRPLSRSGHLLLAARGRGGGEPRSAHRRRRADLHRHDPLARPGPAEQHLHDHRLFRRDVVDQRRRSSSRRCCTPRSARASRSCSAVR